MEKIVNYIKNGKGCGFIFLLATAVLVTLIVTVRVKEFSVPVREEIINISRDFLPITVSDGKIVNPSNTYIRRDVKVGDEDNGNSFPVVLDTRSETSVVPSEKVGIFIMTDQVYMIAKNEIKKISLEDGTINQDTFNEMLDSFIGSVFFMVSILYIVILSFIYFLEALAASWIGSIFVKYWKKEDKYNFVSLMRLSSIIVACLEIVIGGLRFDVNLFVLMFVIVFIELYYIYNEDKRN